MAGSTKTRRPAPAAEPAPTEQPEEPVARRDRPKRDPVLLTQKQLVGIALLLAVTAVLTVVGTMGLVVLADVDKVSALSHTQFAVYFHQLVSLNMFFPPLLVNGGAIGLTFCIGKLIEHRYAVKKAAEDAAKASESSEGKGEDEAKEEQKKSK